MDNNYYCTRPVNQDPASPPNWRVFLRQHSEKLGTLAEDVVLPKNERDSRRISKAEDVLIGNSLIVSELPCPSSVVNLYPHQAVESKTFPMFMIGISVIQIILFYSFDKGSMLLIFGYDPYRRHEVWRFITMMIVHNGYSHLWGNLILQLLFGVLLEIVHKWKRISIIYLASVFGGSLCVTVVRNDSYSVGASAGVYGLLFGHLATIILNWNEMEKKFVGLVALLMYMVCDLGQTLNNIEQGLHISHSAHLGGAITGFLVSILVLKNFKEHPWEKRMQKLCFGILIAVFVIVVIINTTALGYYLPTELNFRYNETYCKHS